MYFLKIFNHIEKEEKKISYIDLLDLTFVQNWSSYTVYWLCSAMRCKVRLFIQAVCTWGRAITSRMIGLSYYCVSMD